jgi:hypothetical protein
MRPSTGPEIAVPDLTLTDRLLTVLMEQPTPTTNEDAEALAGVLAGVLAATVEPLTDEIERLRTVAGRLAEGGAPLVAAAPGIVRCPVCGAKTRFADYGDVDDSETRWRKMQRDPAWHYETCPFRMAREVMTGA